MPKLLVRHTMEHGWQNCVIKLIHKVILLNYDSNSEKKVTNFGLKKRMV